MSCRIEMVVLVVLVMVEGHGGRGGHVWTRCVSKKDSLRAQTTRDASFGPIFAVSALPVTYFIHIQPNI